MIITLAYYPEAISEIDAKSMTPEYRGSAFSFDGAIEFIGKIERIEQAKKDKAVLNAVNEETIPF